MSMEDITLYLHMKKLYLSNYIIIYIIIWGENNINIIDFSCNYMVGNSYGIGSVSKQYDVQLWNSSV